MDGVACVRVAVGACACASRLYTRGCESERSICAAWQGVLLCVFRELWDVYVRGLGAGVADGGGSGGQGRAEGKQKVFTYDRDLPCMIYEWVWYPHW